MLRYPLNRTTLHSVIGNYDNMELENEIFSSSKIDFERIALKVFEFQYDQNEFYRQYCESLKISAARVTNLKLIPYLPIQFFKSFAVAATMFTPEAIFESSGTGGTTTSRHYIKDLSIYEKSFLKSFELIYGKVSDYCILGLLPSYLEKNHSSLVYMVKELIKQSCHPNSGFYLYDHVKLHQTLLENEQAGIKSLLIGVTYALLDFVAEYPLALNHTIIIETGGMKGRKEELTREMVHNSLNKYTGLKTIHSEYGMTELLSQAYSTKEGIFLCPPWMKIMLRATDDPFDIIDGTGANENKTSGVINVIDLANLYSCSFIATDDVGKLFNNGSFEVNGRLDNSDIRGCGLMYKS